jgi:hypothetical protein
MTQLKAQTFKDNLIKLYVAQKRSVMQTSCLIIVVRAKHNPQQCTQVGKNRENKEAINTARARCNGKSWQQL